MAIRETVDVIGHLTKMPGRDIVLNQNGPMTRSAAGRFAERMRQLGYTATVVRHLKGAR